MIKLLVDQFDCFETVFKFYQGKPRLGLLQTYDADEASVSSTDASVLSKTSFG